MLRKSMQVQSSTSEAVLGLLCLSRAERERVLWQFPWQSGFGVWQIVVPSVIAFCLIFVFETRRGEG